MNPTKARSFNFLSDLHREVYCRLQPSKIHGVGVFAISFIPEGLNPMRETRHTEFEEVPVAELEKQGVPESVRKLVKDMCPEEDGTYFVPDYSLNEIGISFYLNHSDTPNMREDDGDFYAIRDIQPGEELTVDYGTYGKLNL